jgi:hypothetical protein
VRFPTIDRLAMTFIWRSRKYSSRTALGRSPGTAIWWQLRISTEQDGKEGLFRSAMSRISVHDVTNRATRQKKLYSTALDLLGLEV